MRTAEALADRDGLPMYLETNSASNVSFYSRYGFETKLDFSVNNLSLFSMLRPAQSLGGHLPASISTNLPLLCSSVTGAAVLVRGFKGNGEPPFIVKRTTALGLVETECGCVLSDIARPGSGPALSVDHLLLLGLVAGATLTTLVTEDACPSGAEQWARDALSFDETELPYGRQFQGKYHHLMLPHTTQFIPFFFSL